jgi:hypothetical protein
MTTTTKNKTLREALNQAQLNELTNLLAGVKLGDICSPIKVVMTGGALTAYDITTAAFKALSTITGITLQTGENLPPIGHLLTLRVTAATTGGTVGSYMLTDASGTALTAGTSSVVGLAKISDDGKTLTFVSADVTAFVLEYLPRAACDLTAIDVSPAP